MTEEEYQREKEELERLVNEYNRLVARRNRLVEQYNALVAELNWAISASATVIANAKQVNNHVVPLLTHSVTSVTQVAQEVDAVKAEIEELSQKYFIIKNISTASKKLTQLNDEYRRKFGLYETLRRVSLGYVIGVDKNIISNETLRKTVEKNYLQNADYWLSHCIMATMLWVSHEKEAAERAVSKAMNIDARKSALFFLLVNLRFGRSDAAAKWLEYYMKDINVNNIGDEVSILLQAYLYNICGEDPAFKRRMREAFVGLLASVKFSNANYDEMIKHRVLDFVASYVHKTHEEFVPLVRTCGDYNAMIAALSNAEKNALFAVYFTELLEMDSNAPRNMAERIENVLYDLINTYDEEELQLVRSMDYNDMILRARGDISAAQRMYNHKYNAERPQNLGDLMVKLALPSAVDEVDVRVRKFAVSFLCDSMAEGFEAFGEQYRQSVSTTHPVTVDGFSVTVDEAKPQDALTDMAHSYDKRKNSMIAANKTVKALTIGSVISWIVFAICAIYAGIIFASGATWSPLAIALFAISFLLSAGLTAWLFYQRRKVAAEVEVRKQKTLTKLKEIIGAIADWRQKFDAADANRQLLQEIIAKFKTSEEGGQ